MHFYMFNPADFNNSTRHLSLPERAIYRDLIDMYYNNEQAIDTSNMDSLARRLLCDTAEYRTSLDYILDEYFVKRGKRHHHHRIDKEIKNYQHANRNGDGNAKRNAVTNGVTQAVTSSNAACNDGNAQCNVTSNADDTPMTNAERTRKARQDKRNMIDDLTSVGVAVDKGIGAVDLRELHATHINSIAQCHASNVTSDVTEAVTPSNAACNDGNAKNAAITINHEPVTNNHKPVSERDAHTNAGEMIIETVVDNFSNDSSSVDNSTDSNQPVPVETETTQPPASQPVTQAQQIRSQRANDIENWEAPTIDEMRGELFRAGKMMQLTDDQYSLHVDEFKAHYAEQALLGKPISTESNRKAKLRKWLSGEVDKAAAVQARQDKAKGTFNIDNEDWSGTTASQSKRDSDIPDVFHPSHSKPDTVKRDPKTSVVVNGLLKDPLPGIGVMGTYEYIKTHKMPGEMADETYNRLLNEMQEAV